MLLNSIIVMLVLNNSFLYSQTDVKMRRIRIEENKTGKRRVLERIYSILNFIFEKSL